MPGLGDLPCSHGLKSKMNVPALREETLPLEEISTFSVYNPMGALAGLPIATTRLLPLLALSAALQPPVLLPEIENTAFVLADSEGWGPVRETENEGNKESWVGPRRNQALMSL